MAGLFNWLFGCWFIFRYILATNAEKAAKSIQRWRFDATEKR